MLEIATKTEEDEEMNETCLKKKETDKRVSKTTIQLKRWFLEISGSGISLKYKLSIQFHFFDHFHDRQQLFGLIMIIYVRNETAVARIIKLQVTALYGQSK